MQTLEDEIGEENAARLVLCDLQLISIVEGGLEMGRDAHLTAEIIRVKLDSMHSELKYPDVDMEEED